MKRNYFSYIPLLNCQQLGQLHLFLFAISAETVIKFKLRIFNIFRCTLTWKLPSVCPYSNGIVSGPFIDLFGHYFIYLYRTKIPTSITKSAFCMKVDISLLLKIFQNPGLARLYYIYLQIMCWWIICIFSLSQQGT